MVVKAELPLSNRHINAKYTECYKKNYEGDLENRKALL